jgi:large subunit ribosomal protein LP1
MSINVNNAETIVAYAALILADEGLDITPEKLQTLIEAANIEEFEPIWTKLFADALQGKVCISKSWSNRTLPIAHVIQDVKNLLTTATASTAEVGRQQSKVDGNEQEKPKEEADKENKGDGSGDEDSDMEEGMFGLFD